MIKKRQIILSLLAVLMISGCGSGPKIKPISPKQKLIQGLVSKNKSVINEYKNTINSMRKALNLIQIYQLAVDELPYRVVSNSQLMLQNIHHYSLSQQIILKQILLWAYAHPIYRQETGKQVRILQRTELLVAPSDIDFNQCLNVKNNSDAIVEINQEPDQELLQTKEIQEEVLACSPLRAKVVHIISGSELNETLNTMASNDPCINLTQENIAGDAANQCLASRKGDLKINLLSVPNFLSSQWELALE